MQCMEVLCYALCLAVPRVGKERGREKEERRRKRKGEKERGEKEKKRRREEGIDAIRCGGRLRA